MKQTKKNLLTRELLDEWKIKVEFGDDGQPVIYQEYRQTGKVNHKKLHKEKRTISFVTGKHKYGEDRTYKSVWLNINGKIESYLVSNIVWVYFNGQIPVGYDIDHINDNSLDDRLENLQLLTRQENLQKRGAGSNQHTVLLTPEEREQQIREKEEELRLREQRKEIRKVKDRLREQKEHVQLKRTYYEIMLGQAQDPETKKWISKRIKNCIREKKHINKLLRKNLDEWLNVA